MNFLVTGGAGFIGSHVCDRLLRSGHAVWVFDDLNNFYDPAIKRQNIAEHLKSPNYHLIEADIRDMAAMERLFAEVRFDVIVHLAARAGVRPDLRPCAPCSGAPS